MSKIINRFSWLRYKKHMRELPVFSNSADKSQYFNLVTINDMVGVQKYLDPIFTNPSASFAFRGVNCASYRIFSSVQRRWYWDGLDDVYLDLPSYIKHQIQKARKNKFIMENLSQDNDYNILALIQHYEGNSNLVDFSYLPTSAFFFAWNEYEKEYPKDGSLKDYVSLYAFNIVHPDMGGPIKLNYYASNAMQKTLDNSHIPADDKLIEPGDELNNLDRMPYLELFDGTVVEGGKHANVIMSVPYFNYCKTVQVNNANIAAQDGCFIQANSGEMPLEEYMKKNNPYASHLLYCFDIHKSLVEEICRKYNVPQDKKVIYPHKEALENLYKNIKGLDKHVFRDWILNGCKKIKIMED